MDLPNISPTLLDDNPWQPRDAVAAEDLQALADDFKRAGLLNPPRARPHPVAEGRYQIASGHSRRDAWKLAFPGKSMPVFVVPLDDRQMAEESIAENIKRINLTPIERAKALRRYLDEFKVNQADAAKLFGLSAQGSVSNALRLLELPIAIQKRLGEGVIAERAARELLPLMKLDERKAITIVEQAAVRPEGDRSEWIAQEIDDFVAHEAQKLRDTPWPADFPKESIRWAASPDGLEDLPRCKGCPSNIKRNGESYCVRPACYQFKLNSFSGLEVDRISKLTGILRAVPGDKSTPIYPSGKQYDWEARRNAQALVAQKAAKPHLRLVLWPDGNDSAGQRQALGSAVVGLVAVNKDAIKRLLAGEKPGPAKVKASKPPSAAELKKQKTQEEAEQQKRRKMRCEFLRAKHDVLWLIETSARAIGKQLTIAGGVLLLAEAEICRRYHVSDSMWPEFGEMEAALMKAIKKESTEEDRRFHITLIVIGDKVLGYHKPEQAYDWPDAQGKVKAIAFETFTVKLPLKWNEPPIHHTEYNCWHCGAFAASARITKRDVAEGWMQTWNGKQLADVRCPKCGAAKAKPAAKKK